RPVRLGQDDAAAAARGARPAVGGCRPRLRHRRRQARAAAPRPLSHGVARLRRPALHALARRGADRAGADRPAARPRRRSEAGAGANEGGLVGGRGGWLRLPEEFLLRVGIHDRARAHLEEQRIVVTPTAERPAARETAPGVVALPSAAGGVAIELRGVTKRY